MNGNRVTLTLLASAVALSLAACGGSDKATETTGGNAAPAASTEAPPASTAAPASTEAGGVSAACASAAAPTKTAGTLTVGTDKPGYPPYIQDDDPTNGKGFESAVAYAVAARLGFAKDQVKWTVVPFNSSYAPGPKEFDFDINQIGINPDRQSAVDFSDPYYTTPQSVVVLKGSKIESAATLADVIAAKIGVQVGTTTLDALKALNVTPEVFDDTAAATAALKNGQIDGLAVDLPTGIYLRDAELTDAKIVGTFGKGEDWGLLAEKGSTLVPCLNEAIAAMTADGSLASITQEWMGASVNAPELK